MLFITGATGFIGSRLVPLLDDEVYALVRKRSEFLHEQGVQQVVGDITKPGTYESVVRDSDMVVHLASILDEKNRDLWKVNVEGTRALLKACDSQRFIMASSTGIFGESKESVGEWSEPNPVTDYEYSKLAAEKLVVQSGLPYTIIRPTLVYGPNKYWKKIVSLAAKNFPLIGDGSNYFHTVFVDDVVRVFSRARREKHVNEIYNIASHEVLTLNETYDVIKKVLGVSEKNWHVPADLAYLGSRFTQFIPGTVFIPEYVRRLTRNRIYDVSKSEKAGLSCTTSFEDGIKSLI